MKTDDILKYLVGTLAAVVLAGLLVWLIRNEGERTRQTIRDSRGDAETSSEVAPRDTVGGGAGPAGITGVSPDVHERESPAIKPDQHTARIATAADTEPRTVEPSVGAEGDFNLDDHVVFPGLADEVSKFRGKTGVDSQGTDRSTDTKKANRARAE